MIGYVHSRSRRHNEIGPPALGLVKTFRVGVGHFNSRKPFHMFFAEVAWHDHAQRVTMPVRQWDTVHFVGEQRGWLHGFFQQDGIGVIINAVKAHAGGVGKRRSSVKQVPHRNALPASVADQARVQAVADTHERRFLLGHFQSHEILKSPRGAILHEPIHFKVPEVGIHLWVDHVLRHAIKQFVRRNWLDDAALVLRAVVAECCGTIKFASQRNSATRGSNADCAQDKCSPADGRTEFVVVLPNFSRCQKLKAGNERSLEQKNAQREAYECDQTREVDWQANIACAQDRPQRDCERNDRQQNKDQHRPH